MSHPRAVPGFWQSIGILLFIAALQILSAGVLGVLGIPRPGPSHLAVVNLTTIGAGLALGWLLTRARPGELFPLRPVAGNLFLPFLIAMAGATILLSEADNLLRYFYPPPAWLTEIFTSLIENQKDQVGAFIALVIVAPLTEELLFRGLLLRGFLMRYSQWRAIVLSSLLFAVFHFNPWQFTGALTLGIFFAWIAVRTGSLFLPLLGHALNNALPLLVSRFDLEISGFSAELTDVVQFQPLWFDSLGALCLAAGLSALLRRLPPTLAPSPDGGPPNSHLP